jgi:DNA helicase HerA-like ATPase
VGIYFVTQNPQDIPDSVLGQLGNRVQHALRAFTPQQQKFIKNAAVTYRANPDFAVETAITDLAVGEALVSTLEDKGNPSIVQRVLIRPPASKLGVASAQAHRLTMMSDGMGDKYAAVQDRESAYEVLKAKAEQAASQAEQAQTSAKTSAPKSGGRTRETMGEAAVKSMVRAATSSIGRTIARELIRGVLGGLKR